MLKKKILNVPKIWFRSSMRIRNGLNLSFRWEQLSEHRYDEFVNFHMNYYVKHEITHVVAGIHKNPEAMEEYREIVEKKYKDPVYNTNICCLDDEDSHIVAFDSLYLYRKGETYKDFMQGQTAEVRKFFQILHEWNNLCPVPEILETYGVEKYMDDAGCAVHPKYRGCGITSEIPMLRHIICKANTVPLTGMWLTAVGTQKTIERNGWETVYEINYKKLEEILAVKFQTPPPTFIYKVKRVD